MRRTIGAGLLGYIVFVMMYAMGALLAWTILGEPPFNQDSGALTTSWTVALLLLSITSGLTGGWACRRVGQDRQSLAILIAILVGLALLVVLTEIVIGPTASGREFVERLVGPVSPDMPFAELLDGRPRPGFTMASYVLAIISIVMGSAIAQSVEARESGTSPVS